jgi:hypothetical protein
MLVHLSHTGLETVRAAVGEALGMAGPFAGRRAVSTVPEMGLSFGVSWGLRS